MLASSVAYQSLETDLSALVAEESRRIWGLLSPADLDASWAAVRQQTLTSVMAGQAVAAQQGAAYVGVALAEQGIDTTAVAEPAWVRLVGQTADGRDLGSLIDQPLIQAKQLIGEGLDPVEALARAGSSLERLVTSEIADAGTVGQQLAALSHPAVSGHVRQVGPSACKRCLALAGRLYRFSSGFARHPRCHCQMIPTTAERAAELQADAQRYAEEGRIRGLTKEEAELLRQQPTAVKELLEEARQSPDLQVLGRGADGTPQAILDAAGRDREVALQALRDQGYLLEPAPAEVAQGLLSRSQYDALMPTREWSAEKREAILTALHSTPEGRVLADTLERFQDGGSIARLRTKIEKRLQGEAIDATSAARADAILDAIRHAPPEWAPETLYRGMTVKGKLDNVIRKYQAGDSFDLNLTSFSTDRNVAKRFQSMTAKGGGGETRIMVELVGDGKKVVPLQNLPKDKRLFREKEWVSSGRFRIVEVKRSSGAILLRIRQEATL